MPRIDWLKALPWLVSAAALIAIVGWIWLDGRAAGVAVERPKVEVARDDSAGRRLEAQGERASADRVEAFHNRAARARDSVAGVERDLAHSGDADEPMDPARAERLRAHDRELCRLAPHLEGCAGLAPAGGETR
jgi:hypothetical protein